MGFTNYYATSDIVKSVGYSMLVGILKELKDSQELNNKFDKYDIKYDIIGSIIGGWIGYFLSKHTNIIPYESNGKIVIGVKYEFKAI